MTRHRKSLKRSRRMRGGSYSSASTFGEYVTGSGGAQFGRVFDQSGAYGRVPGNAIIGAQGQNVSVNPSATNLSMIQNGGRRRRRHRSHNKRGGFVGEIVNQAIVPLSLLGMQQTYRRKRGGKSRRTRRRY
jgi:hypothetical protein